MTMTKKQLKARRRAKRIRKYRNVRKNNIPKHLRDIPSAVDAFLSI